ncbi:S1 RNA-binding domain-containing protein [Streptomyces sp. G6]|uniref:S1 RNA-binding domain-containing protein n=1 Tax=Streptomyces sp. G6 TaxID=1178736 RepID=UPI003EDA6C4D
MTTANDRLPAAEPAPVWARRAAHAVALCALPSGLWRIAMASGVHVGYSDQVLRDVYDIPGWGIAYVVGLSVLAELAALLPLLLVSDRWRPLRPAALTAVAWAASGILVLVALWQLVVAVTVESRTYLSSGAAQTVWGIAFAPLFAIPVLTTAVTWSYAKRHRGCDRGVPRGSISRRTGSGGTMPFMDAAENAELWAFLSSRRKGEIMSGRIASIESFGVFVALDDGPDHPVFPGVGFITIPELSWRHFERVSDVVRVGQHVTCVFLQFDTTNGEARLSLRGTRPDPFRNFAERTAVGQTLQGQVTRLVPFGAFVQVTEDIEGLVHLRELAWTDVEAPEEVVQVGDRLAVVVTEVDPERRRVALSRRQALPQPRAGTIVRNAAEADVSPPSTAPASGG